MKKFNLAHCVEENYPSTQYKLSFYQKIFFIVSFDRLIIRCLY